MQSITAMFDGVTGSGVTLNYTFTGPAVDFVGNVVRNGQTETAEVLAKWPSDLRPGIHAGTITVSACVPALPCTHLAGSPATIDVSYEITGIGASPSILRFELDNTASAADLAASIMVRSYPEEAWTAQTNQPWLRLSRSSGSSADLTPLDVSIDESQQRLANGRYEGVVRLTTTSGISYNAAVILNVQRTQVSSVTPYVATLFTQAEVIIRGFAFDAATVAGVQFGGVDATAFRIISPTEIRATHPSLNSGTHAVTLSGAAANAVSLASLVVANPAPYIASRVLPSAAIAPYGEPIDIVYDAALQRIYVAVDRPAGSPDYVARYSYSSSTGNWGSDVLYTSRDTIRSMTMAADGESVLLSEDGFTWNSMGFEDPAIAMTFARVGGGSYSSIHIEGWRTNFISDIAIANDGHAVLASAADSGANRPAYLYDSIRPGSSRFAVLAQLSPVGSSQANLCPDCVVGASADGSRVLLGSAISGASLYEYDASSSVLSNTQHALAASDIQLDRTGNRILLNRRDVYDRNYQLLGQLPPATLAATFSPGGETIYAYDSSEQFRSFNSTTLAPIRTWAAVGSPGNLNQRLSMAITTDGWTLLLAGSTAVLVQPVVFPP